MEITEDEIQKFRDLKKIKNKMYYEKHKEEVKAKAKAKYVYVRKMEKCEVCNCELANLKEHLFSIKHINNLKQKQAE